MKQGLILMCFFLVLRIYSQLPETDIFLASVDIKNNLIKIGKAENITNRKGYDNQPVFASNNRIILFSSSSEDKTDKIHIHQYDIKSKKITQHTKTTTSEYSPMLTPDKKYISSVVVEEDSTQRIWLYDPKTGNRISCLTEGTDSIGYYAWLGTDSILYYKLTSPHSLRVLNIRTGKDNWLCDHPTRSFKKIDSHTFFYVLHEDRENQVYVFDIRTRKATLYATDRAENQDYVWEASLGLVKSEQNKLYRYSPETNVWAIAADMASYGITKISRFSFSSDGKKMAIVSNYE
jgi:hypothetical protein